MYQEKYWDFGPTLATEKLEEEDKVKLSAETLRTWLKSESIWRQRKAHRGLSARLCDKALLIM